MPQAKTVMIQGTASTVGKSTIIAGLCHILAQEGWHTANCRVHEEGDEEQFQQEIERLQATHDLVIIEGAGSPVELNQAACDKMNMHIARQTHAPVILVGDSERGGVFASLLGTLMLLEPEDHQRVKGLIVNKAYSHSSCWKEGARLLNEQSNVPVLGTIPFIKDLHSEKHHGITHEETQASMAAASSPTGVLLDVVVVRFPCMSNADEFERLSAEPTIRLRFAGSPEEFPAAPDLIILPGTTNTLADLAWLWRQGLVQHIQQCAQQGSAVLGISGGYQMLGDRVSDPLGVEAQTNTVEPGLGLLAVETCFEPVGEMTTAQCQAQVDGLSARGLFARLGRLHFRTYQTYKGRTSIVIERGMNTGTWAFETDTTGSEGYLSTDGWCAGCYLHGLFDNENFRHGIITALTQRRSRNRTMAKQLVCPGQINYHALTSTLRKHLDMEQFVTICGLKKE